jgi:hypothetical protein
MIREWPNVVTASTHPCSSAGQSAGTRFACATIRIFILWILTNVYPLEGDGRGTGVEGQVESNERYYRRRAVEERMAAQRAVTETARAWHSKLAQDFAERASTCTAVICNVAAING